jgi:CRP/FNR family cyclic AMP-dependent transcriptional regulator
MGDQERYLATNNLLAGLPREYFSRLLAGAPTRSLRKNETLFEIGAEGDGCYWLEEGVLKVCLPSPQGAERIIALLGPGSLVGELAMLDGLPRSATIQAVRDSRLTFVARSVFLRCLREDSQMYAHLVASLVERLRQADKEVAAASFMSLKARVARALLQFAKHLGEPGPSPGQVIIRHRIRQDDLAALAHVARESASRILSDWKKRKVIDQRAASLFVIHQERLEREARLAD